LWRGRRSTFTTSLSTGGKAFDKIKKWGGQARKSKGERNQCKKTGLTQKWKKYLCVVGSPPCSYGKKRTCRSYRKKWEGDKTTKFIASLVRRKKFTTLHKKEMHPATADPCIGGKKRKATLLKGKFKGVGLMH